MYEMGILMEKRNYYVDAQRYYEWAENQSLNEDLARELEIRWIICRIKQAKTHGNDLEKYNSTIDLALEKIRTLGLSDEIDPNDEHFPEFKFDRWSAIYKDVMSLPSDKQKPDKLRSNDRMKANSDKQWDNGRTETLRRHRGSSNEKSEPVNSFSPVRKAMFPNENDIDERSGDILTGGGILHVNNGISESLKVDIKSPVSEKSESTCLERSTKDVYTDYTIKGYRFKFNPHRKELLIKLENQEEDLTVKIKRGKFPEDGEFSVNNKGRLVKSPDQSLTPFNYASDERGITITDTETGMSMLFPLS